MSFTAAEGRQRVLDDLAGAIEGLAVALACLSEAYEGLDEQLAERLEDALFRPVQSAYATARRTHSQFAGRYSLAVSPLPQGSCGTHSADPRVYIRRAVEAAEQADLSIAELQDSLLPVEVGDQELRAGLTQTRAAIAEARPRGEALLRSVGR